MTTGNIVRAASVYMDSTRFAREETMMACKEDCTYISVPVGERNTRSGHDGICAFWFLIGHDLEGSLRLAESQNAGLTCCATTWRMSWRGHASYALTKPRAGSGVPSSAGGHLIAPCFLFKVSSHVSTCFTRGAAPISLENGERLPVHLLSPVELATRLIDDPEVAVVARHAPYGRASPRSPANS